MSTINNKTLRSCAEQCTNEDPQKRGSLAEMLPKLKSMFASRLYKKGRDLYKQKNFTESISYFHKAAKKGDVNSQFELACCYSSGKAITQNHERAVKSQKAFAFCLKNGTGVTRNESEAFKYFKLAAEQNIAEVRTRSWSTGEP